MCSIIGTAISLRRSQMWITYIIMALSVHYVNTTPILQSNNSSSFHPNTELMRMSRQFVPQTLDYSRAISDQYPEQILPQYGHLDPLPEQFIPAYGATLSRHSQPDIFRNQSFAYPVGYRSPYNGSLILQEPYTDLHTRSEPQYISPNYRRPPLPKMPVIRPNFPRLLNGSARYDGGSLIEGRNSSLTESEDPRNPHLTFKHPGTITNFSGTGPITSLRGVPENDVSVTNRTLAKNAAVKPKLQSRVLNKTIAARRAKKTKPVLTRTAQASNSKPANPESKTAVKKQPIKDLTKGKSRIQARRPASLGKHKKAPFSAKKPSGAVSQAQPALLRKVSSAKKGKKPFATRPKVKPGQVPKGKKVVPLAAVPVPGEAPVVAILRQDTAQVTTPISATETLVLFSGNDAVVLIPVTTTVNESQQALNDTLTMQSSVGTDSSSTFATATAKQDTDSSATTDGKGDEVYPSSTAVGETTTSITGAMSTSEPNPSESSATDSLISDPTPSSASTTIPSEPSATSISSFELVTPVVLLGDSTTTTESSTTASIETTVETFTLAMQVEQETKFASTDSTSSGIEMTNVPPISSTTATVGYNKDPETSMIITDDGAKLKSNLVAVEADSTATTGSDTSTPILTESTATTSSETSTLPASESSSSSGFESSSDSTLSSAERPSVQTTTADLWTTESSVATTVAEFVNEVPSTTGTSLTDTLADTSSLAPATDSTITVASGSEQDSTFTETVTAAELASTAAVADADFSQSIRDSTSVAPNTQASTSPDTVTDPATPDTVSETGKAGGADVELTTAATDSEAVSEAIPTGTGNTSPDAEPLVTSTEQPSTVDTTETITESSTLLSVDDGSSIITEEPTFATTVLAATTDSSSIETTASVGTAQTADAFTAAESHPISTETPTAGFTEIPVVELTSSASEAPTASQAGEEASTIAVDSTSTKPTPEVCIGTTAECEIGSIIVTSSTNAAEETPSTSAASETEPVTELLIQTSSQSGLLLDPESSSISTISTDQISNISTTANAVETASASETTEAPSSESSTEATKSTLLPESTPATDSMPTENTEAGSTTVVTGISQDATLTTDISAANDASSASPTTQSWLLDTSSQPAQTVISDSTAIPDLVPSDTTEVVDFTAASTAGPEQAYPSEPFRLAGSDVDVSTPSPTDEITSTTIEINGDTDTTISSADTSVTDGLQDESTETEFVASNDEITRIAQHWADSEFISATSDPTTTPAVPVTASDVTTIAPQTLSELTNAPAGEGSQEHVPFATDSTESSSAAASTGADPEFVENTASTPIAPQEGSTAANGDSFSDIEREGS